MANIALTIVKNEDILLEDFIVYHLNVGFDRIIVLDDGSDMPVHAYVERLPTTLRSKVDVLTIENNLFGEKSSGQHLDNELIELYKDSKQNYYMNYACKKLISASDWIAFLDADEFLHTGSYPTLMHLRADIQNRGSSGIIFDSLLYGHGFHLRQPSFHTVCSFLWCAKMYYGHGKFFAHGSAIASIPNPHIPIMQANARLVDSWFRNRAVEFTGNTVRDETNDNIPHVKHFILQDVQTCFRRRLRGRIASREAIDAHHENWVDRVRMLNWTSSQLDLGLAAKIIDVRVRQNFDIHTHIGAISEALAKFPELRTTSAQIDFAHLGSSLGHSEERTTNESGRCSALFEYFTSGEAPVSALKFIRLPADFNPARYRSLYNDLTTLELSDRELVEHYVNCGRGENRRY